MSLDLAYFDNLRKHLVKEKYRLGELDLRDIRTKVEHLIIGRKIKGIFLSGTLCKRNILNISDKGLCDNKRLQLF